MPDGGDLPALAAGLASGEVSAGDLARDFLDRVRTSPATFISVDAEHLLQEARASDGRRRSGEPLSPYDGIPFAVKDNIDAAGYRTTNGSRTRAWLGPARSDAPIVATLRAAGLLVAGKTNLSEFAFSGLGLNPHFGTPGRHRHDPPRAPGGSSAGSAIAVADNLVALALGTDTAGSLRVPPAFTGTVGFRATSNRYPMSGVVPLAPSFDTLGAVTRTVADMIAFDGLARGRPNDVATADDEIEILVDRPFLRFCGVAPDVEQVIDNALRDLRHGGARILFRRLEPLWQVSDAIARHGWPGGFEAYRQHAALLAPPERDLVDPRVLARLELGGRTDPDIVAELMALRVAAREDFEREAQGAVVFLPTVKHVPPLLAPLEADDRRFAEMNLETLRLTMIASFLDAPAVALPAGLTPDGLPVSLSLLAPRGHDGRVLVAASHVERLLGSALSFSRLRSGFPH
ncbi:glutamyl-tRNA amidotransferase (plasmid) [Aminobacter sp. SR38]|jgi:aspartyl-tRNA(Asn)/glutamyl-tRNA(Gln) amidotransferase subunit A|uniref:amidase family protein n=1 Tax=Aminobacter sp. SR38 TaxID=2774562 RepID=UPI0017814DD6|nr:amidase family protein [Aminobacter sp. SR38]QOF75688.1 glutamyl-tRNA amidotransferase [Aminobacter sp. SR38]